MSFIFHPSTNTISKASIFGFLFFVLGAIALLGVYVRSPYVTDEGVAVDQPIPFYHEHHVSGLGISCQYCHAYAEESAHAGIPPTETCMTCHSQIWTEAPALAPVRESWATGEPLQWNRVHDLADYVYFNHSVHVTNGIGCESCHGNVPQMPFIQKGASLQMAWCIDCHREPEAHLRPLEEIYTFGWEPPIPQEELGRQLITEYDIPVERLTDCTVCHR